MDQERLLTQFSQAANIVLHIFEGQELVYKSDHKIQDYNLPLYLVSSLPKQLPPIWVSQTPEHLYMGGLRMKENGRLLFVGPLIGNPCSLSQARQILQRLGRSAKEAEILRRNLDIPSVCDRNRLKKILLFLNHLLNGLPDVGLAAGADAGGTARMGAGGTAGADAGGTARTGAGIATGSDVGLAALTDADIAVVEFHWSRIFPAPEEYIAEAAEEENTAFEQNILSMVRHGKVAALTEYFDEYIFRHGNQEDIATRDIVLRRDYMIGANMLLSRVAVDRGVDASLADTYTGHYIMQLESAGTLTDLNYIFYELAIRYTQLIRDVGEFQSDSAVVRQVNSYVQAHLYDKLSTAAVARALHFSQSYLCAAFKKASGMTVTAFIRQSKVREAEYLLDRGSLTPAQIAEQLAFSSHSYFGAVFKEVTGKTPGEYRAIC